MDEKVAHGSVLFDHSKPFKLEENYLAMTLTASKDFLQQF